MSEIKELKSVLTLNMWIFVMIFAVIMSLIGTLSAPFSPSWAWCVLFGPPTGPLITLFVLLLLSKVAPSLKNLSRQKLAIFYTVSSMALVFSWSMVPYGILHNSVRGRLGGAYAYPPYTDYLPWIFGPSDPSLARSIMIGGAATDWGAWAPWLGFWITYVVLWLIFWLSWMALLEEQWIKIEKLPFPFVATSTTMIDLVSSPTKEKEGVGKALLSKLFAVGFILGAITIMPPLIRAIFPWVPDLYGWSAAPYVPWFLGALNLAAIPATSSFPVWAMLSLNPMHYVLFFLFPIKTLFSIWVVQLVGILIPSQIAWYAGYYSGIEKVADRLGMMSAGLPFKWSAVWVGMFVGLIIFWFILNPEWIKRTLQKPSSEKEQAERALPYRMCWALIIISSLALIGMITAAGANILGAIIIVFTMWSIFLSGIRVFGHAGPPGVAFMVPSDWGHMQSFTKYLYVGWMTDPAQVNVEYNTTMWLSARFTGALMAETNTQFGMAFALPMAYKVGYDTGTHPRDITKAALVSGIISAIIGFSVALWFDNTVGTAQTPMKLYDAFWVKFCSRVGNLQASLPAAEPCAPWIIGGIVVSGLLVFLNMRFVWWPIDPVGAAMAMNYGVNVFLMPALIACIAKTLVFRTGGTKLYENYAMPIALGFIVGYWVLWFFGAAIGLMKFVTGA